MTEVSSNENTSTQTGEMSEQKPAAGGGAPTKAGKMMIPDLTPMTVGQDENVQVMAAITKEASSGLQDIVAAQQAALKKVLAGFQSSIEDSSGQAGFPSEKTPDIQAGIKNMGISTDSFCATAEALTKSTTSAHETLMKSVNVSMAKIEEAATKFSGG